MTEPSPSRSELVEALALATSAAVTELFREYPAHHFYYCSLITTGEALAPSLVAWSTEGLDAAASQCPNDPNAREELKWSYADSPFYCYGEKHFVEVRRLFDAWVCRTRTMSEPGTTRAPSRCPRWRRR